MAIMTKRVNIKAPVAIRNINPPIYGNYNGIIMSTGDILKCLCKRAIVDEVLPDGSTVRLTMRNYYTDNGAGLDATKINPAKPESVVNDVVESDNTTDSVEITKNEDAISDFAESNTIDSENNNLTDNEEMADTESETTSETDNSITCDEETIKDIDSSSETAEVLKNESESISDSNVLSADNDEETIKDTDSSSEIAEVLKNDEKVTENDTKSSSNATKKKNSSTSKKKSSSK